MDYQFWIWLIIIVITFLARARKKPKPPPQREPESWEQEQAPPSSRPLTFEELLREIQAAKEPRRPGPDSRRDRRELQTQREPETQRQLEPAPPIYKEVDYDDDLGEEEQDLETIPARDERVTMDVYEKAKQEAFQRPSLEETMKLEDTVIRFGAFKEYESSSEKSRLPAFLAELHDPEGLKKAFILSEILTRRV